MLFYILIGTIGGLAVGGVLGYLIAKRRDSPIVAPSNPIPDNPAGLDEMQARLLEQYQREWQVVIETQMYFNDLIIRFRGLTLTAFAALTGGAITVGELTQLTGTVLHVILALPVAFWLAAMALDLGYYHRLLVGAVGEAAKYDENAWLRSQGFFGLTATVRRSVPPIAARYLVVLYYMIPWVIVVILMLWLESS